MMDPDPIVDPAPGDPLPPGEIPPGQNDPFAPDPTGWPPPPDWLFPAIMVTLSIAVLVVLVLLYAWYRSIQITKAEQAKIRRKDWIDLSELSKKGIWADEKPRVARPSDEDASSESKDDDKPKGLDER